MGFHGQSHNALVKDSLMEDPKSNPLCEESILRTCNETNIAPVFITDIIFRKGISKGYKRHVTT